MNENEKEIETKIIFDAIEHHNIDITPTENIKELVRYVYNRAYNDGWKDGTKTV